MNTTRSFIILGTVVVIRPMSEIYGCFVRDWSLTTTITVVCEQKLFYVRSSILCSPLHAGHFPLSIQSIPYFLYQRKSITKNKSSFYQRVVSYINANLRWCRWGESMSSDLCPIFQWYQSNTTKCQQQCIKQCITERTLQWSYVWLQVVADRA